MARTMWDASTPPTPHPTGYDAAAGYIGGDTPHIWTLQEWRQLGSTAKLPIWVQDGPQPSHAEAEAFTALERLYEIGCPRGSTVALDLETSATAATQAYVKTFHSVMQWAGFYVWVYGSRSTVFTNPPCDGYWVADYTGQPHFAAGPSVRATQWTSGPAVDKSVVKYWSWRNRLWR